jgi:hypothetical protein
MTDRPPSVAVVEAVADERGIEPTALSERLSDVIDTEALDVLFEDAEPRTAIQFYFCGYRVTVTSEDGIAVNE